MAESETKRVHADARRGRGSLTNLAGRFESERRLAVDDGWGSADAEPPPLRTTVTRDATKTIIARNQSPDIPFDRSINPYRGCEHGCIYCFARPTHAYLGLSPGLDFESRLFAKPQAAELLRRELGHPHYRVDVIAMGTNTDPYQPIERDWKITRAVLDVLAACHHPVSIVTKSALVLRDIDILAPMAARNLASVFVSVTTLDRQLARRMEPRAATPERRLDTLRALGDAGIPTGVMVAPVIPGLNDHEIEAILSRAKAAGVTAAGYITLRLPLEINQLWRDWLALHYPDRAAKVTALVRSLRGGRDYDSKFGGRMTGTGPYAAIIANRFRLAAKKLGLDGERRQLDKSQFVPPQAATRQLALF